MGVSIAHPTPSATGSESDSRGARTPTPLASASTNVRHEVSASSRRVYDSPTAPGRSAASTTASTALSM